MTDAVPSISLAVSVLALFVSCLTAWLTLLRRGVVQMTRPSMIYLGPDGGSREDANPRPKIFFRTLLYATARRGRIIDGMYVRARRGETTQNFSVWVYRDGGRELSGGSGLFVPDAGFVADHHFVLPDDAATFQFDPGEYVLDIYASLVGEPTPRLLHTTRLSVTPQQSEALRRPHQGLFFDWGPESARYHAHIRPHPKSELPQILRDLTT